MKYDVIVLGSGPGGYVTAIRASQLGLKTAVVEREALGGICLNWGCIPTKALLKSANVFEYIEHAEDYGISVAKPKADFGGMVKRSRGVADGMSKGVQFLMKKNKIDVIMGNGKLLPGKQLEVTDEAGKKQTLSADHIIIATGARSRQLPSIPQNGKNIIGYREAMTLKDESMRDGNRLLWVHGDAQLANSLTKGHEPHQLRLFYNCGGRWKLVYDDGG